MDDSLTLTKAQIDALTSPPRGKVYEALRRMGSATAIEIASSIGKSPATIHYHLQELIAVGLATEVGKIPSARRPVSVYEASSRKVRLPDPAAEPGVSESMRKMVSNSLKRAVRDFEDSSIRAEENPDEHLAPMVIRLNVRLKDEDRLMFEQLIEEAVQFADSKRTEAGRPLHWASILIETAK